MSNGQTYDGNRPLTRNIWIVKPSSSSRGRGIYIIDDPSQVNRQEACVVSRYLDNPLLLYGHKFDLRLYVVVTSFDPLRVYIYREGLVRFASERYSNEDLTSDTAMYSHLTNYSINKNNEKFVKNDVSPLNFLINLPRMPKMTTVATSGVSQPCANTLKTKALTPTSCGPRSTMSLSSL